MSDQEANKVREEAYRAAAGAVDRILERIGVPGADYIGEAGAAGWDRFQAEMSRVVDLNLDMVRNAFGLYSTLLSPESFRQSGQGRALALGPVVPGSTAGSVLWLHNYDAEPLAGVALVGSALRNSEAGSVEPQWAFSPKAITVPAGAAVPVMVEIVVPEDTPAGSYQAMVTPRGRPGEPIDVRVEVVASAAIPHDSW